MRPVMTFPKANTFAFFYEEAHLLLLSWNRDDKQEIYRISGENEGILQLDYPGALYTEKVMEIVAHIFFITVQESQAQQQRYTLGAYFTFNGEAFAVYYERDASSASTELIFFRVEEAAEGFDLQVVEDETRYAAVVKEIEQRYGGFLHIH